MNEENNSIEILKKEINELQQQVADLQDQIKAPPVTSYLQTLNATTAMLMQRASVDQLLQIIVQQSTDLARTTHGFIYLLEDDKKTMRSRSARGLFEPFSGRTLIPNKGVVGHVWRTGEPLTIVDYPNWEGRVEVDDEDLFYSAAAFPLKINNVVIGVLALAYEESPREFTPEIIEILSGFAHLAAIAIDNAKLYQELTQNQYFTRRILDTIPEIVRVQDKNVDNPIYSNDSMIKILGYTLDDVIEMGKMGQKAAIHPDDYDEWITAHHNTFDVDDDEIIEIDYRIQHKDGYWLWMRRREVVFQRDENNIPYQSLAIIYDITTQKEAELALQKSQQFSKKITEAMSDIIRIYDIEEKRNIYGNDAMDQILGYTVDDIENLSPEEQRALIHPDDLALWQATNKQLLADEANEVFEIEFRIKDKDNKWRWLRRRDAIFERYSDGKPKQTIGIAQDITEQKNNEQELRKQAQLLEVINDAIISTDAEFRIESWNKGAEMLYGWSAQDVIGKSVGEVIPPRYPDGSQPPQVLDHFLQHKRWEGEVIQPHQDGTFIPILSSVTLISDENGEMIGSVAVNRDITSRKKVENALKESQYFSSKVAETIPEILRVYDLVQKQNIFANRSLSAVLGYTLKEWRAINPATMIEMVHPDDHEIWSNMREKMIRAKHDRPLETIYRLRHKNGQWRWLRRRDVVFQRDNEGNPTQILNTARDITKEKEAEAELQRQAHLLEVVNEAIVSCDTEFRIQSWNKGAEKLYGWQAEEVLGKPVADIIPTSYPEGITEFDAHKELLKEGYWEGEIIQFHRNDTLIYIFNSTTVIEDDKGKAIGTVAVNRDITMRKQVEIALKDSQHFVTKVTDTIPEILRVFDLTDKRNIFSNQAIEKVLGYSVDEINSLNYSRSMDLIHSDDREEWENLQKRLQNIKVDEVIESKYRVRHANGDWRWLHRRDIVFQTDDNGEPTHTLNITQDITESRRAQQELYASEQRFRTMMETTHAVVFLFDTEKGITYINPASERILGFKSEELIGAKFWASIHKDSHSELNDLIRHYGATAELKRTNLEVKTWTKQADLCWLDLTLAQVEAEGKTYILGTAVDITDRKRAEERTVAYNLEKQKVQMIANFITTMSHDFRTPLSTLNTSLYLLERDSDPERKASRIAVMQEEIGHLENLIQGLISMTRLDSDETAIIIQKTNINDTLRDIVTRVSDNAKLKNQILLFNEKPIDYIEVDGSLIYKAVLNLVENAIHYTPEGGKITLGTHIQNDELLITVQDTGIGIEEEDHPHIFERFYRADKSRSTRQIGLGLSIAQKITELHGGYIDFTSQVNVGSEFVIHLPILDN